MKKRFTLLSTALLMGTSLSVFAQEQASPVDKAEWKEGNYFYLTSANSYLALDAERTDSVLVRSNKGDTKDEIDLALWQIKKVETTAGGDVYQFTNKATKAVLSFSTKANATTVLDPSRFWIHLVFLNGHLLVVRLLVIMVTVKRWHCLSLIQGWL